MDGDADERPLMQGMSSTRQLQDSIHLGMALATLGARTEWKLTRGGRAQDNGRTRTTRWAHEKPPPPANPRRVVDAAAVDRSQAAQHLHAEQQRAATANRIVDVNTLGGPPPLAGV